MNVIQLRDYSGRPASELISRLHDAVKTDKPSIILDDADVVGTLLSADLSRDVLAKRLRLKCGFNSHWWLYEKGDMACISYL